MDKQVLMLTLAALAFGLALNLKLTLSVLRASRREREMQAAPVAGQPVRGVMAKTLAARARVQLAGKGQASVLLFLSSRCPKCSATLPELEMMLPAAQQAGLAMWMVSEEWPWRLRRFLHGSSLLAHVARLNVNEYRALNPTMSSPAYLFVNHEGVLEAAGLIGDANWLGLRTQLSQDASAPKQAA